MGLITFFLLGAFSLFHVSSLLPGKPGFVIKAVDFIGAQLKNLSVFGFVYGIIATLLVAVGMFGAVETLVRLAANVLIILFALPHTLAFAQDKANDALRQELSGLFIKAGKVSDWVGSQTKVLGMIGAIGTLLMFGFVFN